MDVWWEYLPYGAVALVAIPLIVDRTGDENIRLTRHT
jgi:hypothetical protein